MFKKIGFLICTGFAMLSGTIEGVESKDVDYDWLINTAITSGYTDHIPHWRRLFNTMHIRGFLECGCGFSTKYFMDNVDKVISIEYITPGYGDKWYQDCLVLYANETNWIPMTYNADYRSNSFNNACAYQCSMHRDYALIDPTYLTELDRHFKTLIYNAQLNGYNIDVAFVDPGVYVRGDLVKVLLANKIPIVAAHDTASDVGHLDDLYGWVKVTTPPDYVKIYIPFGQGTTFWIRNTLPDVITSIQAYRDAILQQRQRGNPVSFDDLLQIADSI